MSRDLKFFKAIVKNFTFLCSSLVIKSKNYQPFDCGYSKEEKIIEKCDEYSWEKFLKPGPIFLIRCNIWPTFINVAAHPVGHGRKKDMLQ